MCKKEDEFGLNCLKCENMVFPDMPNGSYKEFQELVSICGIFDAMAFNPNMYCPFKRKGENVYE